MWVRMLVRIPHAATSYSPALRWAWVLIEEGHIRAVVATTDA